MAFPWGLVTLVLGFVYGLVRPGKQNKTQLLKTGILIGLIVALVLVGLGLLAKADPTGLGLGFLGILVSALILSVLFVLGVWVGDLVEGARHKA